MILELLIKILREILHECIEEYGVLAVETIEISERLDKLIVKKTSPIRLLL